MIPLGIDDIRKQLLLAAEGGQSLEGLQREFARAVVGNDVVVAPAVERLFYRLFHLIEDDSISLEERRGLVRSLSSILSLAAGEEILNEWWDVIVKADRIAHVVQLWLDDVISRTSYLSAISELRLPPTANEVLAKSSPQHLGTIGDLLRSKDFARLPLVL